MSTKVSVIIPSYNCKYAARTVDDVLEKATGDVEVILLLDAYWPLSLPKEDKRLTIVHKGTNGGMRNSINLGVQISKGDYIMKLDDHCSVAKGFDEVLKRDTEKNWLTVPTRYSLDPINWTTVHQGVCYEYMAYPYSTKSGIGLYSRKWWGEDGFGTNRGKKQFYWKEDRLRDTKIDDIMIFQGSCWFMHKSWFLEIGGLDEGANTLYQEPQELTFKTWLSGGRCVVNKNTWYAHLYKTDDNKPGAETHGRGYKLDLHAMRKTERAGNKYWMLDQWPKAKKPMKWLIEKFWPIPGWPPDWEQQKLKWEQEHDN
jgi:GT2 family glycosyltransferase